MSTILCRDWRAVQEAEIAQVEREALDLRAEAVGFVQMARAAVLQARELQAEATALREALRSLADTPDDAVLVPGETTRWAQSWLAQR